MKSKQKDPPISVVLGALAILCFVIAAVGLFGAAISAQMILVAPAISVGISGFLLIALSQIIIYLDRMTSAVESTSHQISKLVNPKSEPDPMSGGFR
jgi:amino acid transporter